MRQNTLKYWRKKANMTQMEFSRVINVGQPQLSRYERQLDQPWDDTCYDKILPGLEKLFPRIEYDDLWKYIKKGGI